MPEPIFKWFMFKGRKYLAIANVEGFHIIDDAGFNFGAFASVERFKVFYLTGPTARVPLGSVRLLVQPLRDLRS